VASAAGYGKGFGIRRRCQTWNFFFSGEFDGSTDREFLEARMTQLNEQAPEFLATFTRQRQQLLHHAGAILTTLPERGAVDGLADVASSPAEGSPKWTQLLVTSLEELKVAEEEMLEQHLEILSTRGELERMVTYYKALFDLAPSALLLTTTEGSIRACNRAATSLLMRDTYHLEGKPIPAIVPREHRSEFRQQLSRLSVTVGVSNWRFTVERPTDSPLEVTAAVHMIPSALTGSAALYWHVRAVESDTN
jgi:PAS domain S-box-containing protein